MNVLGKSIKMPLLGQASPAACALINESAQFYPGFASWWMQKVVPGIQTGPRRIIELYGSDLIGLAILKMDLDYPKISTFVIDSNHRGSGLGQYLLDVCREILDAEAPLITIPEERFAGFSSLMQANDFEISFIMDGYYRPGSREFFVNARPKDLIRG